MELVEPGVLRQVVQCDLFAERVVQKSARPAHGQWRSAHARRRGADDLAQCFGDQRSALNLGRVIPDERAMEREAELRGALAGCKSCCFEAQRAPVAQSFRRRRDLLMRYSRALEREGRMNALVAMHLTRFLQVEGAGDVRPNAAATPAVEGAFVDRDDGEELRADRLRAIFVLNSEHARHRRGVGAPKPGSGTLDGGFHLQQSRRVRLT